MSGTGDERVDMIAGREPSSAEKVEHDCVCGSVPEKVFRGQVSGADFDLWLCDECFWELHSWAMRGGGRI